MLLSFRAKVSTLLSLFVIFSLGLALIVSVRGVAHASAASITLSPPEGPPTTSVTVSGTGFRAKETVTIAFDTTPAGTATTDSTGAFTTTKPIAVPNSAQPGGHSISATGQTSGSSAQATFLVQTNWTTFGFDAQQDHFNPYENVLDTSNVPQLTAEWTQPTQTGITSEPVVVNGIVYIDTPNGFLYAFNACNGQLQWSFEAPNPWGFGNNSVAVDSGVVYAAAGINSGPTKGGKLYAFNATTGAQLWSQPISSSSTSPVVFNGVVYVGAVDQQFYAFSTSSGAQLWAASLGGITDTPTIANETLKGTVTPLIYVGLVDNKLQVLNATSGSLVWSRPTAGPITGQAVVNGVLYVTSLTASGSLLANLYALSPTTDFLFWSNTDPAGYGYSGLAVTNGSVYASSGNATTGAGTLNAFSTSGCGSKTCSPIWSVTTSGSSGYLTVANGVLYGSFSDKMLKAFDASTGTVLWTFTDPSGFGSGIAVVNGVVFVGSLSSTVDAFYVYVPNTSPTITLTGAYGNSSGPPETALTIIGV